MSESARCSRCREVLPLDNFHVANTRKGTAKRQAYCKVCCSERAREYRSNPENRARILAKQKEHYRANRERLVEDQRRRARENPERVAAIQRRSIIKRKYGMTDEDYDAMVAAQDGKCLICLQVPEKRLYIDHDHVTGRVRGLLCTDCNTGLGLFRDDARAMRRAIHYLLIPSFSTPTLGLTEESA